MVMDDRLLVELMGAQLLVASMDKGSANVRVRRALALRRTPACRRNSGSTGRKFYIAPYKTFSFRIGFFENRDSK